MQRPRRVGSMTWSEFNERMRRITRRIAMGISADIALSTLIPTSGITDTTVQKHGLSRFIDLAGGRLPEGVGWVGEGGLHKASTLHWQIVVTVRPVDGKPCLIDALREGRRPEPGEISSMLGVLVDGEPVASYIYDVRTLTLYTRRPYDPRLLRVTNKGAVTDLARIHGKPAFLSGGALLCYGGSETTNPLARRLLERAFERVVYGEVSLGLAVSRVLSGDLVGVMRLAGGNTTPWGETPIAAMCNQGDLVALRMSGGRLIQLNPISLVKTLRRPYDILYVGRRHLGELRRHAPVVML